MSGRVVTIPRPPAGALVITERPDGDVRLEARRGERGRPRSVDVRRNELAPVARALDAAASSPPARPRPPLLFEPPRRSVDVVVAAVGAHRPGVVARVMLGDDTHSSTPRRVVWVDVRDVARDAVWHSDELPLSREAFEALAAAATREAAKLGADDAAAVDAFLREFPDRETWPNGCDDFMGRASVEPRTLRQYWEAFPGSGAALVPGPLPSPPPPVEVARVMLWCGRPGDLRWLRVARVVITAPGSERAYVQVTDGRDPERWIVPMAVNVSRGAFEALEAAALAAAPEGSRAGIADAMRRWADATMPSDGIWRESWGPPPPRTLREFWAVMPESGATLASPEAVDAARAAPQPEQPARPAVDAARAAAELAAAAAELARNRAMDEAAARRRAHAASVADAKTGRRPLALRATADELAAAARARAEFAALPPDEQRKARQAAWDAAYAAAYAAAVEDDLRRAPLRPSTGAPADAPADAHAPPGSR